MFSSGGVVFAGLVCGLVGWVFSKVHTAFQDWRALKARHLAARRAFFGRLGTGLLAALVAAMVAAGWITSLLADR